MVRTRNLSKLARGLTVTAIAMLVVWQGLTLSMAYAAPSASVSCEDAYQKAKAASQKTYEAEFAAIGKRAVAEPHIAKLRRYIKSLNSTNRRVLGRGLQEELRIPWQGRVVDRLVLIRKFQDELKTRLHPFDVEKSKALKQAIARNNQAKKIRDECISNTNAVKTTEGGLLALPEGRTITATVKRAKGAGKAGGGDGNGGEVVVDSGNGGNITHGGDKGGKDNDTGPGTANLSPAQIIQKVQALLNQSCPDCQELAADVEAALKAYRKIVSEVESRFGSVEKFNEEYKRISAKWYSVNPDLTKDMDVFAPEEKGIADEVLSLEVTIRETPRIINIYKEDIAEQEKKFSEYRKNGVTPDKFGLELYNSKKKDLNSLEKELRDAKAKLKEKKKELEKIKRNRDAMSLEELSALKKKEMELSKIWGSLFNKFVGLTMRLPLLSGCIEDYCPKKEEPGKGVIPGGEVVVGGGTGGEEIGTGKHIVPEQYERISEWYRKAHASLKDCRNIKVRAYLKKLQKAASKYSKSLEAIKADFGSFDAFERNAGAKETTFYWKRILAAEDALVALLKQADGMKKLCATHKGSGEVVVGNGTGAVPAESQKGDGSVKTNKFGGYPDGSTESGSGYGGYDTEESGGVALPGGVTSDQGAEIPSPPPLPPLPKLPDSVIGEVAGCPECDSLKNILVKMAYDLGKLRQENISQGAWLKISSLQGEVAKLREVELPARKEKRYKELIDDAKQSKQKSLKEGDEYRIERDQRDIEAWQKQLADLKRNHKKYQKRFDLAQKKAKLLNKQSDTLMAQLQLESDLRDELERGIAMYNNCIADCQKRKKTSTLSDGDDLDCSYCGVELVQVIYHSGNNPLDTTDPVAGGSTLGDTTVTPPPVVTPPTVDTTPPVVTAPASIFVAATNTIGVPKTNGTIATFLNGATATDNVGVVGAITNKAPATFPTTPQVFIKGGFPFGTSTAVTFSASDAAGNTGTATANVEVFDFTGPAFTTGACALPIVHTALGGSVPISDPTIQTFITCVKGAFTDNIDGVIPASGVTVFNDPTPSPLPLLDNPPVTLPPAPESFPAPTTIPSGSINAVRMTPINFKAADNAKNLGWFFTVVTVISP